GFSIPYPSEYRFTRANLPLLTRIAELTGGKLNPPPAQAFRPVAKQGRSVSDLWRSFLWLALALLLLDITVRRVVIPLAEWVEPLRRIPEKVLGGVRVQRPVPQAQATARLLGAKERAGTRRGEPVIPVAVQAKPATSVASEPPPVSAPAAATPAETSRSTTPADTTSRLLELKRQRKR
ncbi:MAG: hypothetical protein RMJ83_08030, partial [Armatimonadota bacterium]|nr:hypothetical protein [Armatimonadota bacterium]